jgi:AbrB family looped-hinge helix DNA binding protein
MATTTLTTKGQLTLPKAMRDELKLKPGDKIDFVKCETGEYVVRPANKDVRALSGFLAGMYKGPPVSIEDMDKGIADYLSKKHARILRESAASDKKRKSR